MSRERLLLVYALAGGALGWIWLWLTPGLSVAPATLALFAALALALDALSIRLPPADAYSLAGVVLLTAALSLGPAAAALIAGLEGLLAGVLLALIYNRPRTVYTLGAQPLQHGGVRAVAILAGATMAGLATGQPQFDPATLTPLPLLIWSMLSYVGVLQLARLGRELLEGRPGGVSAWWRVTWRMVLITELAPLPLALLGAAIFTRLGMAYFLMAGLALIGAAATLRRALLNLAGQQRSVRELAMLNEVSRAIIRSELDVATLCDLIYREASKIVDTSSFHLGLFEGDNYTLLVRVQDRVRLPRLTVDLAAGDGLIGWIRQTGKALLVEDFVEEIERLPARPRYQSERPPRSGIYVPLIAGEEVIGSISVQSYEPGAFVANDLRLLSLIADQAAVVISRARAFAQANQRAVQLQAIQQVSEQVTAILDLDQLLPSVVRLIRERFGYHPVHIFTLDAGVTGIRFRASTAAGEQLVRIKQMPLNLGQGIVGNAAVAGQFILVGDVRHDPRYIRDSRSTRSELAVPLRVGEQVLGVLDVQSDRVDAFDADDLFVIRTLADQIAVAIDSANSYGAQQEEAWTLNALLQMAENIGRAGSVEALVATAVRLSPLLLGAPRCYCLLWEREEELFRLVAAYGLPVELRTRLVGQPLSPAEAPLLAQLQAITLGASPRLLTLAEAHAHPVAWPQLLEAGLSGLLLVLPLVGRAGLLGGLILDYDPGAPGPDLRQTNLSIGAAAQVAGALESLLLAREAEVAVRLEQELQVAREIQTSLLPAAPPVLPGWQIAAAWRSARLVGGDFFDFWLLGNVQAVADGVAPVGAESLPGASARLGFVIADVSDKGVPAALFMALARSLVRAAALDGAAPAPAMERANHWITRDSESGMFVTLFYGVLDPATGRLRYTVAGHNPPLLISADDGAISELRTPGIALGVLEQIQLEEAEVTMAPGDLLVCYTDGVTEAIDEAQFEFGTERLRALLRQQRHAPAEVVLQALLDAVARHARGQPPFDDVTLVVIRRER